MRVMILADELFASRERAMLSRLEVGMADEGVRVIHAIPERAAGRVDARGPEIFSQAITYSDVAMPFADRFRAASLARSLEELVTDENPVDVIHVFGGGVWNLGIQLGKLTEAGVVLEVWRSGLAARASSTREKHGPPIVFLAPDPSIERLLLAEGPGVTVRLAPWGVHVGSQSREILLENRTPSVMVVGTGRDPRPYAAALEGIAQAVNSGLDCMIFMDALAAHRARVWPLAQRLGLLSRLSLIEELEGRRDLVLLGDVLVQPDSSGEQRSILLDAMASGMIVVAASDASVSALIDGRTARLVQGSDAPSWGQGICGVLSDRARSREIGRSARKFVKDHRLASGQVRAILDAYQWLTSSDAIPLRQPPG